jgi:hypothetical protein
MSGHVFHPGHEDLHGVTVVIDDREGRTYVGRYHEATPRGVVLHDVAVRQAEGEPIDRATWLKRQLKFGVQVMQRTVVVPSESAGPVGRLVDIIL